MTRTNHESIHPFYSSVDFSVVATLGLHYFNRRTMRQERGGAGSGECGKVGNGKPGYSPATEGGLR